MEITTEYLTAGITEIQMLSKECEKFLEEMQGKEDVDITEAEKRVAQIESRLLNIKSMFVALKP